MGWRGTLRSIEAASRRAAKNADRQAKAQQKLAEINDAARTVAAFNEYIESITKLHVVRPKTIDWGMYQTAREPNTPIKAALREYEARSESESYTPNFLTKLLKLENSKRQKLQRKLETAIEEDEADFSAKIAAHKKEHSEWEKLKTLSQGVSEGHGDALLAAVEHINTFKDISKIGYSIEFKVTDDKGFYVTLNVGGKEVVPDEKYSQLQSGRLSTRQMPKGEYIEIYQDYVCSCILRVAVEIFTILPLHAVVVTAVDEMVNPQTGLLELQALVSAYIPRESVEKINLNSVDPSIAMKNFVHAMDFRKSRGFEPVTPVVHKQACY